MSFHVLIILYFMYIWKKKKEVHKKKKKKKEHKYQENLKTSEMQILSVLVKISWKAKIELSQ